MSLHEQRTTRTLAVVMLRHRDRLRLLRKLVDLDSATRILLFKSYAALALARVQVSLGKFSDLKLPPDSLQPIAPQLEPSVAHLGVAKQIGWAVRAVALRTPWHNTCLVQALAARQLLQRHDISCSLFLGVRENPKSGCPPMFHAWLKCGSEFVTGEPGHEYYRILYRGTW